LTPGKERNRYIPVPVEFWKLGQLKKLEAVEFLRLIQKKFGKIGIVVGEDFRFGINRQGNISLLKNYFPVKVIKEIKIEGVGIHSHIIKNYFKKGEIEKGNRFLGRPYRIWGEEIIGQGLGKRVLLPTINLQLKLPFFLPRPGVYATRLEGAPSLTFIGIRSTDGQFSLEAHLLGKWKEKERKLEGEMGVIRKDRAMELHFLHFFRPIRNFLSLKKLKNQLERDLEKGYNYFKGEVRF